MRKEIISAVAVGLLFGLLITYGFYRAKLALTEPAPSKVESLADVSPTPSSKNPGKLAIHSPEEGLVTEEAKILVTGTTLPENYVVIFNNNKEMIVTSDKTGNFSAEVALEKGANIIIVHTFDENSQNINEERSVIREGDIVEPAEAITPSPTATSSSKAKVTPKVTITPKATPTPKP